jgi:hypothetical protein
MLELVLRALPDNETEPNAIGYSLLSPEEKRPEVRARLIEAETTIGGMPTWNTTTSSYQPA